MSMIQENFQIKYKTTGQIYLKEEEKFCKEFRIKSEQFKIFEEINKNIINIQVSKLEDEFGIFGIKILTKFRFKDNSELEIKTIIPIHQLKKNPQWIFDNICIEGIESNLNKRKNKFSNIFLNKKQKFQYNKLEYFDIGRLIKTILSV